MKTVIRYALAAAVLALLTTLGLHAFLLLALAAVLGTTGILLWLIIGIVAETGPWTRPVRYTVVRS
jgi:hypothetical protein